MIIGARAFGAFKKIDIYAKAPGFERYLCSTNSARNLKEARERYAEKSLSYSPSDLIARYSKR